MEWFTYFTIGLWLTFWFSKNSGLIKSLGQYQSVQKIIWKCIQDFSNLNLHSHNTLLIKKRKMVRKGITKKWKFLGLAGIV